MIARALNLSPRTVEHHLNAAKIKMNCLSKEELITKAWTLPYIKNRLAVEVINKSL